MSTASDSSALTTEGTAAYQHQVEEAASALQAQSPAPPTVGVLNDVAFEEALLDEGAVEASIPYEDLPQFPEAEGTLTVGTFGDTRVAVLDRLLHLYEGYTPREVVFPVRMVAAAGVETLLLSATAGSVNPQFRRGTLLLLTDHINFQGQNPLVGPNVEDWGPRFPDMTAPYDAQLQQRAEAGARDEGMSLQKGVYLALLGPSPETTAEHRMARRLGADAVGASLVPEVIAARHMDVSVMAVTLLTDRYLTDGQAPASGQETPLAQARSSLRRLLTNVAGRIDPGEAA